MAGARKTGRSSGSWERRVAGRALALLCIGLIANPAIAAHASAQRPSRGLLPYLERLGLGEKQLESATRGRAEVMLLPAASDRDVVVFGIIGVKSSSEIVAARTRDLARWMSPNASRLQSFGVPPSPDDVRNVAFDASEYRDLRRCRPSACDFKLSASAMQALVEEVNWSERDAKSQVDAWLRADILRLAGDYATRGNAALPVYDDRRSVRSDEVFAELLSQSRDLYTAAPELYRYLLTYPSGRPAGVQEVLYWSEDRLPRMRPMLTVSHATLYTTPGGVLIMARKQLYASHYFEGALELLAAVDAGVADGGPATYLLLVRRVRFDNLPGGLLDVRGRVRDQLLETTRADLERHRATLELPPR
jgi:hypothetical protein